MNKKIFLAIIAASLLLAGCGKIALANSLQKNEHSSLAASAANSTAAKTPGKAVSPAETTASNEIDFNQYIKKTWVEKKGTSNASFCITKIADGKITGRFSSNVPAVPNRYNLGNLTGEINKDTAECQFSDTIGNKGNIKLVFKSNGEMEATIKLTDKSKYAEERPQEGTFQFIPYNLNNIKGFSPIESQSFMVNLNSWGNVKFVTGKLTAGNHIPVVFYLTNKDGDILYDFDAALPYGIDVKAVSFEDVNKDGYKDIIIIAVDSYDDSGEHIATVYFQKADGSFSNDSKLDQEINNSGNNKDVKTVRHYLSEKF